MKKIGVLASLSIAAFALLLVVTLGNAQRPAQAAPEGRSAPRVAQTITNTFTYQGLLEEGGQRISGSRQMSFTLYTDGGCTAQAGSPQSQQVQVEDGVFSVNLAFDPAHFSGQGLWLETSVGGTSIGCQPIRPAPYALSLRPGAVISASIGAEEQLLDARSGATSADEGVLGAKVGYRTSLGYPVGLYGYAYDYGSVGVWGTSDSQFGWGVNGVANGPDSIGVRGVANAFTSTTYGVYGESSSPDGYAGYFEHTASTGTGVGLVAEGPRGAVITSTNGAALVAYGSGSSGDDDAVRGEHSSGDGVVGFSDGTGDLDNGVVGFTDGGYGVYGFSNAVGQYAGYFDGPIRVSSCTGCTIAYVSRNTSESSMQVGDVVQAAGMDPVLAGAEQPVMQVAPIQADAQPLGVVLGRTEMTMVEPGADDAKPGPHYGPVGGPAKPGDYLVIVVQGMARVRVDPTSEVQAGQLVGAGVEGATTAVAGSDGETSTLGMVLDEADSDGLAWVLVGFD
jgi:hypothetical protein